MIGEVGQPSAANLTSTDPGIDCGTLPAVMVQSRHRRVIAMKKLLVPLVLAALVAPIALAGPPEGTVGQMALDEVAEGLRKYRKETDPMRRLRLLERLAPTGDPRVAVALGEALSEPDPEFRAAALVCRQYRPDFKPALPAMVHLEAFEWWEKNEADLRRRAQQAP
jgi:hypothetical protein